MHSGFREGVSVIVLYGRNVISIDADGRVEARRNSSGIVWSKWRERLRPLAYPYTHRVGRRAKGLKGMRKAGMSALGGRLMDQGGTRT